MNVIEVSNLSKSYGHHLAVEDISFAVIQGEIFGMLGPNGAGKSTTIECITGLRDFQKGRIDVLGLNPATDRKKLYGRIGVQLQETSYQPKIKVSELCLLFTSLYENPLSCDELIREFGLEDKKNAFVQSLSGGQRQKLSIILALVSNPEIVFLDELTTGLDPSARRSMWAYIKKLKEEGRTVFMTTHYMEEAEFLCDRVCIINEGRIAALDTIPNIIAISGIENEVGFYSEADIEDAIKDQVQFVTRVGREGPRYCVYGREDCFPGKLIYWLEDNQIDYHNLSLNRPSLDEAFIKLTGRSIEEEIS